MYFLSGPKEGIARKSLWWVLGLNGRKKIVICVTSSLLSGFVVTRVTNPPI